MLHIPKRYGHFVFAFLQAGLTCSIVAAIASTPFLDQGMFIVHWLSAWIVGWITMMPVVLLAAPIIRRVVHFLTEPPNLDGASG
jgi:hypothetical protein